MAESDELRAIAKRFRSDDTGDCPCNACKLARAYLAHKPLTRERVEKAVGELFKRKSDGKLAVWLALLDGNLETLAEYDPEDVTDRLCRLLGVEE